MEARIGFITDLMDAPTWVVIWVMFMSMAFMPAFAFARSRVEARWVIVVMFVTFPSMIYLHSQVGYVRLLGLPHVIFWTPLLVYLWTRRKSWRVSETASGKWIAILFATLAISLLFDYSDVIRYIAGERG